PPARCRCRRFRPLTTRLSCSPTSVQPVRPPPRWPQLLPSPHGATACLYPTDFGEWRELPLRECLALRSARRSPSAPQPVPAVLWLDQARLERDGDRSQRGADPF